MSQKRDNQRPQETIDAIYRSESRRVLATLVRLLGDFDLAEEALHEAFRAALEIWPEQDVPANPRAWLISTGRFRGIDAIRRRSRFSPFDDATGNVSVDLRGAVPDYDDSVEDDRLRLIFTCCHPALSQDARIALTLREVCGLTTEAIADAFLTGAPTIAQRIVRAKGKIRDARIPYEVPERAQLPDRLDGVLRVVYLVFNEGYSASSGSSHLRSDLCDEAIRLCRLIAGLVPEPEAKGLLALLLLTDSRRLARADSNGDIVLLEAQDRTLWDRGQIEEGLVLTRESLRYGPPGAYSIQAAIAAVHAEATSSDQTDWREICGLYDLLLAVEPSPVVELNRAVAVAMSEGVAEGLAVIDRLLDRGELNAYSLAHAARADLCRRLGMTLEARASYEKALALTRQEPERRFLERRLRELT